MTDLTKLTIAQARAGLDRKEFSAKELTQAFIDNMEAKRNLNAYVCETPEQALKQAEIAQEAINKGEAKDLTGIPLRLIVAPKALAQGMVEYKIRGTDERGMIPVAEAVQFVQKWIKEEVKKYL